MTRCRAALLTFIVVLTSSTAWAADFQGTWQGTIQLQTETRYKLTIEHSDAGAWSGDMIIEDDWGLKWNADGITVDGDRIQFSVAMPGARSSYDGQLSSDKSFITGTWAINQQPLALKFVRATADTEWREPAHRTRFIAVEKDVNLEVLDWGGNGRPLVLLSALGTTAHVFSDFAAHLARRYHVYGITRRGFGASSVPPVPAFDVTATGANAFDLRPSGPARNPYDADRLGDDVATVIQTLGLRRPVLVGHSIGGEELTSVATRHGGIVAGLIYLDALYEYAYSDGKSYDNLFTAEHPWHLTLPTGEEVPSDPGMAVLLGMHEYRGVPLPGLAICAVPQVMPPMMKGNRQAITAYEDQQKRVAERYDRIARDLPTVKIVRIPNAAHFVFQSNEAEVLRQIDAFVSSLAN